MRTPGELGITNRDDIIDVRDVIARVESLDAIEVDERSDADNNEHKTLHALLDDLCGKGGDEKWLGDWYPVPLIRDSYFTDYARELVQDCGDVPDSVPHYIVIDWEQTARNIRTDYSLVNFEGVTYWYRC